LDCRWLFTCIQNKDYTWKCSWFYWYCCSHSIFIHWKYLCL